MIRLVSMLGCGALFLLVGCAAPRTFGGDLAQSRGPQCFRANEVYGYAPGPDGSVDVQTAEGPFRLRLGPGCPDFSWIMQIGVRPMESSWLCEGRSDRLITGSPLPTNLCAVGQIESLGPRTLSQG